MNILDHLSRRAVDSKFGMFIDDVRTGWNSYSFVFYIGGVSAILASLFGFAGWASGVITVIFFYYAGKFKKKVDLERKRREKYRKLHPIQK